LLSTHSIPISTFAIQLVYAVNFTA
jgi:hypothetical protein